MKKMKKLLLQPLVAILISVPFVISCSSDDDSTNDDNNPSASQTIAIVQDGTWRVTSFIDSGQDETSDFNGYVFTFESDGTLRAENGSNDKVGTWAIDSSSSSDDDGASDDDDFIIFFNVPDTDDFEDLNDDWDILSASDTKIELRDISGGNGGTDTLTFEKN
ncbi:hypothetical protein MG296_00945 [Flavobacteriaceae bacterium TK19130]|nr:hypothetical protein [Thermobacterium salinum]